jgi:very-short-patch-repair endonuclease/predicted transcriptional regulator of viral defense system
VRSKNHNSCRKSTTPEVERVAAAIGRLAARQQGMVTRVQLLGLGLSAREIDYRVRTGRLWRVHHGVYCVGRPPVTPHEWAMAAVLACGRGAALSHRPGGALWEIGVRWPTTMEVTAPSKRSRPGIRVHRSPLDRRDITRHYGIPVTTLARTLLDLAEVLDTPSLTRAVNEARLRRKATLADLAELLHRSPGRATKRLRPFVERVSGPTRSEFEDAFLAFVHRHGLPTPEMNQIVAGYEVDAVWRKQRLVVELDGREFHENAFEADRERDATLLSAGLSVLRITWHRLNHQEQSEADRLQSILDQRSTTPGPAA